MKFKLPSAVYSLDHARFCVEELIAYSSALGQQQRTKAAKKLPQLSSESTQLVEQLNTNEQQKPESILQIVSWLEVLERQVKTLSISLVSTAPYALKQDIVVWLRDNIHSEIMVDFHVNPDIAGGVVVRTPRAVYDHSFRTLLLSPPKRFTEVLDHV